MPSFFDEAPTGSVSMATSVRPSRALISRPYMGASGLPSSSGRVTNNVDTLRVLRS
jgi:hypothetical protein